MARAAHAIRADLPVAIASGFIDEVLRAQAAGAGVRELIFKAGKLEEFCEAFERVARMSGRRLSQANNNDTILTTSAA